MPTRDPHERTVRLYTHRAASEVDGVIDLLRDMGATVRRLNFCQFPEELPLAMKPRSLNCNRSAGWIHDLGVFSFEHRLTGLNREIALNECNAFLDGLLLREKCNWLNDPRLLPVASSKPYQLALAERLGIPVPPYIITNDAGELKRFQRRHASVVIKAISSAFITYGKTNLKFYTRRFGKLDSAVLAGLRLAPVICQREVPRVREVRITVVDGRCYSVGIDCSDLPPGVVDIRQMDYARERHRFSPVRNLPRIEAMSKTFVRQLGLNYAGLDWAITKTGQSYLFEANPLASFKWFELMGAGNITRAIADALLKRADVASR